MEIPDSLRTIAARIELVCFDVDGVLTNGMITYDDDHRELKSFHVRDGAAIKLMQKQGLTVAILTGRTSNMVERRAAELGIDHLYQGLDDKLPALLELLDKLGLATTAAAHVGDDLPDLEIFGSVGLSISVADAHPAVLARADFITRRTGGHGVAAEVAELLLRAQNRWPY